MPGAGPTRATGVALPGSSRCTDLVRPRDRRQPGEPVIGACGQAVIDQLLANLPGLESCEHDKDGFALWISVRPGHLLCGFCYQAAQVLAEDIRCVACGRPAGDPDRDSAVVAKLADNLGAHFYLCHGCADSDLNQ